MRAHFGLPSVEAEDKEGKPPISVKFEIPYFTTSGIQVCVCVCLPVSFSLPASTMYSHSQHGRTSGGQLGMTPGSILFFGHPHPFVNVGQPFVVWAASHGLAPAKPHGSPPFCRFAT